MIIILTLTPPACSSHSRLLLLLLLPQIPTPSTLLHAANTTLEVARCSAVPLGSSSATRHSRCARVLWSMGLMPGPCLRLVSTCRATRGRYLLSMAACVWSMILWTSSAVPHFPWPIVALLWISCAMPAPACERANSALQWVNATARRAACVTRRGPTSGAHRSAGKGRLAAAQRSVPSRRGVKRSRGASSTHIPIEQDLEHVSGVGDDRDLHVGSELVHQRASERLGVALAGSSCLGLNRDRGCARQHGLALAVRGRRSPSTVRIAALLGAGARAAAACAERHSGRHEALLRAAISGSSVNGLSVPESHRTDKEDRAPCAGTRADR
jgi:hypothetical protein